MNVSQTNEALLITELAGGGKIHNVAGEDNDDGPMSIRGGGSTGTLPINRKRALTEVLGRIVCSSRYFDSHSPNSSFFGLCKNGGKDILKRAMSKIQQKKANMRAEYHAKTVPKYMIQSYVVRSSYSHVHLTLVSDSATTSFKDINDTGNDLKTSKNQHNADNHSASTAAVPTCQDCPST